MDSLLQKMMRDPWILSVTASLIIAQGIQPSNVWGQVSSEYNGWRRFNGDQSPAGMGRVVCINSDSQRRKCHPNFQVPAETHLEVTQVKLEAAALAKTPLKNFRCASGIRYFNTKPSLKALRDIVSLPCSAYCKFLAHTTGPIASFSYNELLWLMFHRYQSRGASTKFLYTQCPQCRSCGSRDNNKASIDIWEASALTGTPHLPPLPGVTIFPPSLSGCGKASYLCLENYGQLWEEAREVLIFPTSSFSSSFPGWDQNLRGKRSRGPGQGEKGKNRSSLTHNRFDEQHREING